MSTTHVVYGLELYFDLFSLTSWTFVRTRSTRPRWRFIFIGRNLSAMGEREQINKNPIYWPSMKRGNSKTKPIGLFDNGPRGVPALQLHKIYKSFVVWVLKASNEWRLMWWDSNAERFYVTQHVIWYYKMVKLIVIVNWIKKIFDHFVQWTKYT